MKHFVLAGLLAVILAATGCVGYRAATSPYYTSFYNTYDAYNNCYYHPGYYGGYGHGRNRFQGGGGGGHEHQQSTGNFQAVGHDNRWHGGGSHPGGHGSGGGGHTSSGSSHSGSGSHSSGSSHSGGGSHK